MMLAIENEANGVATIAAYSVVHGREANSGLAVCDLPNGNRCYARIDKQATLEHMEEEEWIGREIEIHCDNKVNRMVD